MSGVQDSCKGNPDVLRNNLAKAIPLLKAEDIVGLIEPINPYSLPNYYLNDFELGKIKIKVKDSIFSLFSYLNL